MQPKPVRALWFIPNLLVAGAGTLSIIAMSPPWWMALLLGTLVGCCYGAMCLLAHEVMHGAVVRSRRMQQLLGSVGLGPFLISPTLWRVWHNEVHHRWTNDHDKDPDVFGTVERFRHDPVTRRILPLVPGSGSAWSLLFFFYWFSLHGQFVLWSLSRTLPGFSSLRRRRAVLDSVMFAAIWALIGWCAGPIGSIFVVALPFAIGNAVVMSYVATNHLLRHRGSLDRPLRTSMSVRSPRWLDRLHFHFSHHVEHHLFPGMSGGQLPLVREWLELRCPDDYVAPTHAQALIALFTTPRLYLDDDTLSDPRAGSRRNVDVAALGRSLSADSHYRRTFRQLWSFAIRFKTSRPTRAPGGPRPSA
jgi:fatty acid desaturase